MSPVVELAGCTDISVGVKEGFEGWLPVSYPQAGLGDSSLVVQRQHTMTR